MKSDSTTNAAPSESTTPALLGGISGHTVSPKLTKTSDAALTLSPDDTAWSLMYGALVSGLNISPKTFQLVFPMTSWNWPTNNMGYTSAAQYDFCATIPQWSATGAYVSGGATYNGA